MNACEKACVYVWRGNRNLQKVQPSAGFGFSGWLKATLVAASDGRRARDGLGTGSGRARAGLGPGSRRDHWHGRAHFRKVQISWQAQHFGKVGYRFRGRCMHHFRKVKCRFRDRHGFFLLLARTHRKSHWHGRARRRMQVSWQGQHFRKVRNRFRGRGITFARSSSTFARSSAKFVAGASLSQGQVQISWQAQHFREVKYRFRGRRSTVARSTFAAGARTSQLLSAKVVSEVNFRSWGLKIATFKYESSARSPLSQPGLKIATFKYESSTRSPLS